MSYVNVTPRTSGTQSRLPSNRILLTNPETGNVVQRIAASRDEKWVFNTRTKRFNMIPKNKDAPKKPIRRNVRIEDAGLMNINLRAVNKVFPEPKNTDVKFSPLRPSLFGLKVKFQKELGFQQFSKLAYDFAKKPFPNGVTRVVVRGDRFVPWWTSRPRSNRTASTRTSSKSFGASMSTWATTYPDLPNGNDHEWWLRKEPDRSSTELSRRKEDFRQGVGHDGGLHEEVCPPQRSAYLKISRSPTLMPISSSIRSSWISFVATANGNEIYKSLKKAVLGTPSIPNKVAEFIPDFEYEFGNKNSNFMQELRELGGKVPKFPDNIYLKFPSEKGKDKKRGGSYVSWKKGYIRIQGADSLTKVLLMIRTIQIWYDQMKRNNPDVLVTTNIAGAKVKKAKKIVAAKENIEKVGRVRLNVYKGKDGTNKLKLNDIRCEDTTRRGIHHQTT